MGKKILKILLPAFDVGFGIGNNVIGKAQLFRDGKGVAFAGDTNKQTVGGPENRNFDESCNNPDYARKLYLIENCIYGVDIQPIAIQISKLRFFISLVIDQKTNNNASENFGIRPLPQG